MGVGMGRGVWALVLVGEWTCRGLFWLLAWCAAVVRARQERKRASSQKQAQAHAHRFCFRALEHHHPLPSILRRYRQTSTPLLR